MQSARSVQTKKNKESTRLRSGTNSHLGLSRIQQQQQHKFENEITMKRRNLRLRHEQRLVWLCEQRALEKDAPVDSERSSNSFENKETQGNKTVAFEKVSLQEDIAGRVNFFRLPSRPLCLGNCWDRNCKSAVERFNATCGKHLRARGQCATNGNRVSGGGVEDGGHRLLGHDLKHGGPPAPDVHGGSHLHLSRAAI